MEKKNPFKQGRLDYILISENLTNIVEAVSIKSGYRSDHSVLMHEPKFYIFNLSKVNVYKILIIIHFVIRYMLKK